MRRGTLKRGSLAALLVSLAVLTVAALPTPAAAAPDKETITNDDPKAGTNVGIERQRAQEPLVAAASAITALDPKRESLGGVRLQVDDAAVEVYWKGEVTDALYEEIKNQENAGVHIRLDRATYSGSELTAAMNEVTERRDSYPGLVLLVPQVEGSGLQAYVKDPQERYEFPIETTVVPAGEAYLTSRFADTPPFWAGAAAFANGGMCTTGFAVHKTFFGFETSRGVLTAGHCDKPGGSTFTTGAGLTIGSSAGPLGISDSTYIVGRSAGRMYDGGVGTGEFSKAVIGAVPNFPGQFVCTSGAATGAHCLILNLFVGGISFLTGGPTFGITVGLQVTGSIAGGVGDSGGPVVVSSNPFVALAAGMIDFGIGGGTCPTGPCSPMLGYVDINWVLASNIGMSLVP